MKTFLPCPKGASVILLFSILLISSKSFAQENQLSDDFKKGVLASSISASTGYQSVSLSWASASFQVSGTMEAGYLIIYSTSAPSLLSAPNGHSPNNAVLNGTVVASSPTSLPALPATTAVQSGLADGTTYNFMIVAYVWDGVNISSYQYSSGSGICVTIPPDAPNAINLPASSLSATSISGSFNGPQFPVDGYVVTYSSSSNAPSLTDGNTYQAGQSVSTDTIAQISNATSFNTTNSGRQLSPSTTYYIHVYSYVISGCNNKPVYSREYLSSDTVTTLSVTKTDTTQPEIVEMIDIEPNPIQSNGWLKISTAKADNHVSITIFTIDGKLMIQRPIQVQVGVNRTNLHTENFSRGVYILRAIFSNGKMKSIPFVKQ